MENKFYKTKEEIESWLKRYKIEDYLLKENEKYGYVINVDNVINLTNLDLDWIPVKFNIAHSSFYCHNNKLTSLEFCPINIYGNFNCSNNNLTSLEFCPTTVERTFNCSYNLLNNLEFCPQKVDGGFYCNSNENLGDLQYFVNFEKIYNAHLECVRKIEFEKLNSVLNSNCLLKKNKI